MKGHIFIKTNDKLARAAERAPDNLLHTTAMKNPNKQTNKQTNKLRATEVFMLQMRGWPKNRQPFKELENNYSIPTAPPPVPFPDKNQTIHTLFLRQTAIPSTLTHPK